ncbi:MAG: chromosomal replication initiator protein DnaA [Candidatus Omnitrophota bacterium]
MENIWGKALTNLESEVNDQVFTAWFVPIRQLTVEDGAISLGVPNKFFENWIKEKYFSLIKAAVQQIAGKSMEIRFEIVESAPEKSAESTDIPGHVKVKEPKEAPHPAENKEKPLGWIQSVLGGGRQLPESKYQEIGLNPRYTFENFVVGPSNRFAHAASLAICEKLSRVYNPLFLYGGVGLGKTHLMQAMGHDIIKRHPRARVLYISSEEFTNQLINAIRTRTTAKFREMYRSVDILLVDDIQFIAGKEATQEEFFHTFNRLHDSHKQIVMSGDRSPQGIPSLEERLVSRFAWGLIADIQSPDFETRIAILGKKSENESVHVPQEVLFFLADKVKTNIREMEGALIRVVAYAKLTGKDLSVDLAKEVLKGMIKEEEDKKVSIDHIQRVVAEYFGMKVSDMKAKKRTRAVAYPRQMAMYLSRELTGNSLPDIGGFFGGRDHTTVLHACEKIGREVAGEENVRSLIHKLMGQIKK